jgi:hypothetical protein
MIGKGGHARHKHIRSLLGSSDFEGTLVEKFGIAPEKLINQLLCFLYDTDETIRWNAVRGVGITVSAIAQKDLERARTIMRRLIWSLNDESGGIGWGAPEAMGEIMAENNVLAREYHRILISYIDENGNLLGNNELERGVMWGINRLAGKRPGLLRRWTGPILAQLKSTDPVKRGLAVLAMLSLADSFSNMPELNRPAPLLAHLLLDQSEIRIFDNGSFEVYKICVLASKLLERLRSSPEASGRRQAAEKGFKLPR